MNLLAGGKCFAGFNKCAGGTDIQHKAFKITPLNHIIRADQARLAGMAPQGYLGFLQVNRV